MIQSKKIYKYYMVVKQQNHIIFVNGDNGEQYAQAYKYTSTVFAPVYDEFATRRIESITELGDDGRFVFFDSATDYIDVVRLGYI